MTHVRRHVDKNVHACMLSHQALGDVDMIAKIETQSYRSC